MLWRIWAAVGAVGCGIAVATVSGEQGSPWASVVLLAALGIGVAATAFVALRTYSRNRSLERSPQTQPQLSEPISERQALRDRETVEELLGLMSERDIDWLHFEHFSDLWRDDRTATFRALAGSDAGRSGIFDAALAHAADRLTGAAQAFFDVYDGETIADPIMRDRSWRMIGRIGADGAEVVLTEPDRIGSQNRLRTAAAEILDSRNALTQL